MQEDKQFYSAIKKEVSSKEKHNKRSIEKMALEYGITDKNNVKELVETAIVETAREIALQSSKSIKERFDEIVELYESQVNLSHRTSQSMLLQQYSTPATISFLMGMYVGIDKDGSFYEPSAGNGMLTIASDGENMDVNEIDSFRNANLKMQDRYNAITQKDSSIKAFKTKYYDGIITNPPFGKLGDKSEYLERNGYTITQLDHRMSIVALDSMKDNGKAAIIIGGHTKYDAKGRIKAGMNRQFFSFLHKHYNVDDVMNVNGKALYSKMGTGFDVRVILINGRKETPSGTAPNKKDVDTSTVENYAQLYQRFAQYFKTSSKMDLLKKAQLLRERQLEILQSKDRGIGSPYIPISDGCFTLEVDTPDSMSQEIHAAIKGVRDEVGGSLNEYAAEKLKYKNEVELCKHLAAEQIDGVSLAIYNIENKNQGIIIGDQTGIGKGRQAASIIRFAVENGYKAIFLTEKPNLFSDLYRDLEDIGSSSYKPFIVNAKSSKTHIKNKKGKVQHEAPAKSVQEKIFKDRTYPKGYDFVVGTYSQFASSKPTIKQGWLAGISDDAIIIMDESHNASGSSATGEFLKAVVKKSKSTIFLSATFAKRPDNMPIYALKTSMQDANMGEEDLVNAISNGGVALQEILSSQLVSEGQMIRRERTYEGIEVNYITLDKEAEYHQKIADGITDIIRQIISFQTVYIAPVIENMDSVAAASNSEIEMRKGTESAGVDNTPYFSKVFNVINQMLFSIKAESVAKRAIDRLKEGKKPVIAFANTMGAFIDDMSEGDITDADFKEVLIKGLQSVLKYTETDDAGVREQKLLNVYELEPEARNNYFTIMSKIEAVSTGIVISPIDLIVKRINEAGYTTSEVTGRSKEVQLTFGKNGSIQGLILNRKKENTNDAFRKFNNNEVDVLLINQSGSTGASAHAVPTEVVPKDEVKQRVMIVLQAELNINTEIQKRGRINRTGQIKKPIYDYVASAIPAEKRLQMMLQKKLKSLDANTTSNQKNSEDLMKSDDFLNKYGDDVVHVWLLENPNMNLLLGNLVTDNETPNNLAHKTSGRVAILPVKEQELFYKSIIRQYQDMVRRLLDNGDYDLEVEDIDLEAKTLERKIQVVGRNNKSLFGGNTYLEKCEVNNLKKPYTRAEVEKKISDNLAGENAKDKQSKMVQDYKDYFQNEYNNVEAEKTEKWKKTRQGITKEKGYAKAEDKQEFVRQRESAIYDAEKKDIYNAQQKIKNQADQIIRYLEFFYIGRAVHTTGFDMEGGRKQVPSRVIDVAFDTGATNPFSPSNIKIVVATTDSRRQLDLKASSMYIQDIQAIMGASYYLREYNQTTIIENWDESTRESNVNRIIRYIVTGNILQGYGKFHNGKLVAYTLQGGGISKGILMPISFSPREQSESNYVNVPIGLVAGFMKGLSNGSTLQTNSSLSLQRQYESVKLYLPSSKTQGGKFFLDDQILKLVRSNNFDKVGTNMVAYVDDSNIQKLFDILQDKFGVSAMVIANRIDEIKGLDSQIKAAENSEKKPVHNKAKVLKLKAKAIAIKQKQLQLKLKKAV